MKSEDATFWMILKHIFGFHTWSEYRYWRDYDDEPNSGGVYVNCEICGKEKIVRYRY